MLLRWEVDMTAISYEKKARALLAQVYERHQYLQYVQPLPTLFCVEDNSDLLGMGSLVWLDELGRILLDVRRCFALPAETEARQELIQIRIVNAAGDDELSPRIPRSALLPITNPELSPVIVLRDKFLRDKRPVTEDMILAELSEAMGSLFLKQKLGQAPDSWLWRNSLDATIIRRGIERHFSFLFKKLHESVTEAAFERCEADMGANAWLLETASVALLHPCLSDFGGPAIEWFIENRPHNPEHSRVAHLPAYVRRAEEFLEVQA
jgi:hypothetical protein